MKTSLFDASFFLPVPDPARALRQAVLVGFFTAACVVLAQPSFVARFVFAPKVERTLGWIKEDVTLLLAVADQNRRLAAAPERWDSAADEAWAEEAEVAGGPFLNELLRHPASRRLRVLIDTSGGTVRHAVLLDARGRSAAIAGITRDYFRGDEAGFLRSFGQPAGSRHVGPLERGHDGTYTGCWVSEALADPSSGEALGVVSIAVDAGLVRQVICRETP